MQALRERGIAIPSDIAVAGFGDISAARLCNWEVDMDRREFIATGLGTLGLALLPRGATAQKKKPITWWYEVAAPENQERLQNLLVKVFNEAHPDQELSIDFHGYELDKKMR